MIIIVTATITKWYKVDKNWSKMKANQEKMTNNTLRKTNSAAPSTTANTVSEMDSCVISDICIHAYNNGIHHLR